MKKISFKQSQNIYGGGPSAAQCYTIGFLGIGILGGIMTLAYYSSSGGRSLHLDCWNT